MASFIIRMMYFGFPLQYDFLIDAILRGSNLRHLPDKEDRLQALSNSVSPGVQYLAFVWFPSTIGIMLINCFVTYCIQYCVETDNLLHCSVHCTVNLC